VEATENRFELSDPESIVFAFGVVTVSIPKAVVVILHEMAWGSPSPSIV
jgi:hypothetical protein